MRQPRYLGVYSRRSGNRAGSAAGGPAVVAARGALFFVWELSATDCAIQELDSAFQPRGPARRVAMARLHADFQLEPSILVAPVTLPVLAPEAAPDAGPGSGPDFGPDQTDGGTGRRKAAELNDDTLRALEAARRARQVETDLRGSFRKALRGLNRPREREAALLALEQLAAATEGIAPVHKHMFRDFGVELRKKSLPELALRCGMRVLELAPGDDHAHFNLARILCLLGAYDEAEAHVETAMRLDQVEPVYPRLLAHIRRERRGAAGPSAGSRA